MHVSLQLITSDKGGGKCVCLSVFVSVSKITQNRVHGFEWNVACRQMLGHGWTNWLTFEPDPDYSPDAGTGLLSPLSYKRRYAEFNVWKIRRIGIGRCSGAFLKWFYGPPMQRVIFTNPVSRRKTFVGGTCAPPSALLVWCDFLCILKD